MWFLCHLRLFQFSEIVYKHDCITQKSKLLFLNIQSLKDSKHLHNVPHGKAINSDLKKNNKTKKNSEEKQPDKGKIQNQKRFREIIFFTILCSANITQTRLNINSSNAIQLYYWFVCKSDDSLITYQILSMWYYASKVFDVRITKILCKLFLASFTKVNPQHWVIIIWNQPNRLPHKKFNYNILWRKQVIH